jgi:hypothetical protein
MVYKYKKLSEFKKDYPKEYNYLKYKKLIVKLCEDMGWVYDKIKPAGYWQIKENVILEARKYKTKSKWAKGLNGGGTSYNVAIKNGWFDECTAHMELVKTPPNYWNKERCMEEARKYKTKAEWYNNSNRSYIAALKRNFFDECSSHMVEVRKPNGHWNVKENVIAEARKYMTRSEWSNNSTSYEAAKRNGWFNECIAHMEYAHTPANYWTKEKILDEVFKYKTLNEWYQNSVNSYSAACRNGMLTECLQYLELDRKPAGYWAVKEHCVEEARKYKTIAEWQKKSNGSKKSASKYGWYGECTAHMKKK